MRSSFDDVSRLAYSGKLVAVIGSIGTRKDDEWTQSYHKELAQLINHSKIDRLYTTGPYMNYVHERLEKPEILVGHLQNIDDLAKSLKKDIQAGDLLFVTGSGYLYLGRLSAKILKFGTASLVA